MPFDRIVIEEPRGFTATDNSYTIRIRTSLQELTEHVDKLSCLLENKRDDLYFKYTDALPTGFQETFLINVRAEIYLDEQLSPSIGCHWFDNRPEYVHMLAQTSVLLDEVSKILGILNHKDEHKKELDISFDDVQQAQFLETFDRKYLCNTQLSRLPKDIREIIYGYANPAYAIIMKRCKLL